MSGKPEIRLQIGDCAVTEFENFRADSDLFQAADAFEAAFAAKVPGLAPGLPVKLYVDKRLVFTGVLDAVEKTIGKSGLATAVRGRDLMGLLVDSCVESYADVPAGETLTALATRLLANVPFINRKAVMVEGATPASAAVRIEPGQSVFEVLKSAARARGLLFYSTENGTFVFGRPKSTGRAAFAITVEPGVGANVITGSYTDDISGRYSKVSVLGTQAREHVVASAVDADMPFYKPFVTNSPGDESAASAAKYAQSVLDDGRHSGFRLEYSLPGFGQNGKNWRANELVAVRDRAMEVEGVFLVFGRTFQLDKNEGARTEVRLSRLGVNPS